MQKILLSLGVLLFLIVAVLGFVLFATSGVTRTADAFFNSILEDNVEHVYQELASTGFRQTTSLGEFQNFVSTLNLGEVQSWTWNERSATFSGTGRLEGMLTLSNDSRLPATLELVKEKERGWVVHTLDIVQPGLANFDYRQPLDTDQARRLVKETTRLFSQAIASQDFSTFHNAVSRLWQNQTTPEALHDTFKVFIEGDHDFLTLNELEPDIRNISPDPEDGVVVVSGFYDQEHRRVIFDLEFLFENSDWKVLGTQFRIISGEAVPIHEPD